jgi:hypothetical protein
MQPQIIWGKSSTYGKKIRSSQNNNNEAKLADRRIKYCKSCSRCWMKIRSTEFRHYNDFPSFGKEKVICPLCKKSRGSDVL